jgi:hypothetical protein
MRWGACAVVASLGLVGFCGPGQRLSAASAPAGETAVATVNPSVAGADLNTPPPGSDPFVATARSDSVGVFRAALERYARDVHDYTCTFEKQELVGGALTADQVAQVKFREEPFSVDMRWIKNADKARRALYVEGWWTNARAEKLAVVEPAGWMARLLVDDVLRPIDGPEAQRAARRRIDQFGFANSLRLILKCGDLSAERGELDVRYLGEGTLGTRPTYVFERRLPYTGERGRYPDRLLVIHLDQEYLLPTCCIACADEAGTKLLGRYVITDVKFNVGLTDSDFARKGE